MTSPPACRLEPNRLTDQLHRLASREGLAVRIPSLRRGVSHSAVRDCGDEASTFEPFSTRTLARRRHPRAGLPGPRRRYCCQKPIPAGAAAARRAVDRGPPRAVGRAPISRDRLAGGGRGFEPPVPSRETGRSLRRNGKWRRREKGSLEVLSILRGDRYPGEIILERRATSNRNAGRDHRGFAGDFPRKPHPSFGLPKGPSITNRTAPSLARRRPRESKVALPPQHRKGCS